MRDPKWQQATGERDVETHVGRVDAVDGFEEGTVLVIGSNGTAALIRNIGTQSGPDTRLTDWFLDQ